MTIQSYMLQLRVKTGGGMHKKSRQLVMNQRSFFLKIGRGDSNAAITGKNPQISVRYFSNFSIPMHKNNFLTAKM